VEFALTGDKGVWGRSLLLVGPAQEKACASIVVSTLFLIGMPATGVIFLLGCDNSVGTLNSSGESQLKPAKRIRHRVLLKKMSEVAGFIVLTFSSETL